MADRVLITPRSYGKTDLTFLEQIRKAGYEPVMNPYGRILQKEEMQRELADCAGLIVGVDPCSREVLEQAPHLRAIAKYGVGTDNIDLDFCRKNQIKVSVTTAANADSVADMTFALLCACARRLTVINDLCHQKNWVKVTVLDIFRKKIGILGLGAVGKGVAKRARGFEMEILAYDVYPDQEFAGQYGVAYTDPDTIFEQCDFITLNLPLRPETEKIVNRESLSKMKKTAIVINTARGGLVDDAALLDAVEKGMIAGAGLDVFNEEPPKDERFYTLENIILSSHAAASSNGAVEMMTRMATANLLRDLQV